MNRSKSISAYRVLAFIVMLAGAMVTTMLLPAYGQQEVDPTWYDPYAVHVPSTVANTAVARSSQPAVAFHRHEAAVKSVSLTQGAAKSHEKPASQPKVADISTPRDREETVAANTR